MYIKMILKGLFRRRKTVGNIFTAAILSAFFIALILLYSDNIERYILEDKFNKNGEWFMAVKSPENPDFADALTILDEHPYLDKPGRITNLYTLSGNGCSLLSGVFDAQELHIARLTVIEGRLPQEKYEAVLTKSALSQSDCDFAPGMKLDFTYKSGRTEHTITLNITGIIDDYAPNWSETISYPQIIFCENPFDEQNYNYEEAAFYPMKESYFGLDTGKLYDELNTRLAKTGISKKYIEYFFIYNTNAYSYNLWYTKGTAQRVEAAILIAGIIAILQTAYTYSSKRRDTYSRLYSLGASTHQVRTCIFTENFVICIAGQALGIICAVISAGALIYVVSLMWNMNFFYVFRPLTCIKIIGVCFFSALIAILPAAVISAKRNVTVTVHTKHINKSQTIVNGIFTFIMSSLIMLCALNIYHSCIEYRNNQCPDIIAELNSFLVQKQTISDNTISRERTSFYCGITDEELHDITDSQSAIQNISVFSLDQMHPFYWKGMENSTFRKLSLIYDYMYYNYRNNISDVTYSLDMELPEEIAANYDEETQSLIVVYDLEAFFTMLERIGISIDRKTFENGECVIFCDGCTSANYILTSDNISIKGINPGSFPVEETIHKGDTLYFDCVYGTIETKVGAKLSYNDVLRLPVSFAGPAGMYTTAYYYHDFSGGYVLNNDTAYYVICSPALKEKLADAENYSDYITKYNVVSIEYDPSDNYGAQRDEAIEKFNLYVAKPAEIFLYGETINAAHYSIDTCSKAAEVYDIYSQSRFLYTVFLIILCAMFILIRQNMISLLRNTEHKNIERYIFLGADRSFFRKKYFRHSLKNAMFVFLAMPVSVMYISSVIASEKSRPQLINIEAVCTVNIAEIMTVLLTAAAVIITYIIISEAGVYRCRK